MRYHYAPIRMAYIKVVTAPNAGKAAEKLDHSYFTGGNVKWYSHSGNSLAISFKTKHAINI